MRISCREILSEKEILERDTKGSEEHLRFVASLERASKIVESWPEWKRVLG